MSLAQVRRTIFKRVDVPSEEELNGGWEEKARSPPHDDSASASTAVASKRAFQQQEEHSPHKKQRLFSSLGDIISLQVGLDIVPVSVHRDVLLSASPGLAELCNLFVSPDDRIIFLLNQCPDTIRALCYWMYHDEICISRTIERSSHFLLLDTAPGLFIKLYLAGEKYFMPRLRNDAIDALLSRARAMDLARLSRYVYDNTKSGSNLRKLIVKVVGYKFDAEDLYEHRNLICQDFLFDLAKAAFTDRDQGFNRFRDRIPPQEEFCANFHVHEKGASRCEMMKGYVVADEESH